MTTAVDGLDGPVTLSIDHPLFDEVVEEFGDPLADDDAVGGDG